MTLEKQEPFIQQLYSIIITDNTCTYRKQASSFICYYLAVDKMKMDCLPFEIWGKIITDNLTSDDVRNLQSTCKNMFSAVRSWQQDENMQTSWLIHQHSSAAYAVSPTSRIRSNIILKSLIEMLKDGQGMSIFHHACSVHKDEDVILHAFDVLSQTQKNTQQNFLYSLFCQDAKGNTPLHYACGRHISFTPESMNELLVLQSGAEIDINTQNQFYRTPLHLAIIFTNSVATEMLIQCEGIRIDIKDKHGMTPLHYVGLHDKGDELFRIISRHPQSLQSEILNMKDHDGMTLLHYASLRSDMLEVVLTACGHIPDDAIIVYTSFRDKKGRTPLHLACMTGSYMAVSAIIVSSPLAFDLWMHVKDKSGRKPYHYLSKIDTFSHQETIRVIHNWSIGIVPVLP